MTEAAKIVLVKSMSDETDEEVISVFLEKAADELYKLADPFKTREQADVVDEYGSTQCDIAAYRLNKRGWDYQASHNENGINRNYGGSGLPNSILQQITPKVGAVK